MKRSKSAMAALGGAIFGVLLSFGTGVLATREDSEIPLEQLRTFSDVIVRIKKNYVEEVSDQELLENAIRGMLNGLDPHSTYLTPDEYGKLRDATVGEFGGLGIQVGMRDGYVQVVSPIDDTPAKRAGIESGDLIIRINDQPVRGMSLNDAVRQMRGKPGSAIDLTIVREGLASPFNVNIVREIIQTSSVKQRLLEPGYGYVRISNFTTHTTQDLVDNMKTLVEENAEDLKGLILDLRSNPGGVLTAAVGVSDAFLEEGLVVYTDGREEQSKLRYNASSGDLINGAPLVILVNGGSASASEIVAGALSDNNRAILLGSKTFGKGSVQTIQDLAGGGALKLTTARYYTPSGRSIQAEGIEPDIDTSNITISQREKSEFTPISEAQLNGHLDNPDSEASQDAPDSEASQPDTLRPLSNEELISQDYDIYEALSLLKGLSIAQRK